MFSHIEPPYAFSYTYIAVDLSLFAGHFDCLWFF